MKANEKSVKKIKSLPMDMLKTGVAFGIGGMSIGVLKSAGAGPIAMNVGGGLIGTVLVADTGKKVIKYM